MVWVTNIDATPNQMRVRNIIPPMQILAATNAKIELEFISKLNIDSNPSIVRKTSIGATIGALNRDIPKIVELMENGMNICRINISHRSQKYHAETIFNIREAERIYRDKLGQPFSCAIAIDSKGPETRTGYREPKTEEIKLIAGQSIKLTADSAYLYKCTNQVIYVNDPNFHTFCAPGIKIMIDDGKTVLECMSIEGACVTCKVLLDCTLSDYRVVTIPNNYIDIASVTHADKDDFKFAIKQNVDIILASLTQSAESLMKIKKYLAKHEGKYIKLVAKIEDLCGLDNIDEIIKVSDGVLFGKGNLGVDSSFEKYFLNQKIITSHCTNLSKPVICTRELWESIVSSLRPRRSEIIDVGHSILDSIDCFLFVKEDVKEPYPPSCLHVLSLTCREAEATFGHERFINDIEKRMSTPTSLVETIAIVAVKVALKGNASAIIVLTECGRSAHIISKYRPHCPILAVTRNQVTGRQSHLYRGIIPLLYEAPALDNISEEMDQKVQYAIDNGRKFGFIAKSDFIVVVFEWETSTGLVNSFRTLYIKEKLDVVGKILYVH